MPGYGIYRMFCNCDQQDGREFIRCSAKRKNTKGGDEIE